MFSDNRHMGGKMTDGVAELLPRDQRFAAPETTVAVNAEEGPYVFCVPPHTLLISFLCANVLFSALRLSFFAHASLIMKAHGTVSLEKEYHENRRALQLRDSAAECRDSGETSSIQERFRPNEELGRGEEY